MMTQDLAAVAAAITQIVTDAVLMTVLKNPLNNTLVLGDNSCRKVPA